MTKAGFMTKAGLMTKRATITRRGIIIRRGFIMRRGGEGLKVNREPEDLRIDENRAVLLEVSA